MRLLLLPLMLILSGCAALAVTGAAETAVIAAEERTFGEAVDDAGIYTEIHHYFLQEDVNDLLVNVSVTSRQGRVLLTGKVNKQETADTAVRLAWKADQVVEVINEIEVIPEGGPFTRAGDEVVEKQLEARLAVTKGINIMNFSVEVVNSKVYFLGLVRNDEELRRVLAVASITKGVKQVISHLKVMGDKAPEQQDPPRFYDEPYERGTTLQQPMPPSYNHPDAMQSGNAPYNAGPSSAPSNAPFGGINSRSLDAPSGY